MGDVRASRHPFLTIAMFLAVVLVAVVVGTFVAVWRAAHPDDASTVERADAILVLGAAEYDGRPSPVFAGRLEHAELLYDQQRAPRVRVVGGGPPGAITTEAEAGRDSRVEQGPPADAVVPEPVGHSTLESLRAACSSMRDAV